MSCCSSWRTGSPSSPLWELAKLDSKLAGAFLHEVLKVVTENWIISVVSIFGGNFPQIVTFLCAVLRNVANWLNKNNARMRVPFMYFMYCVLQVYIWGGFYSTKISWSLWTSVCGMKHFLGKFPDNTKTIQPKIAGKCRDPRKMHTTLLEMRTAKSMPVMT